jgi:Rrf2 family protein
MLKLSKKVEYGLMSLLYMDSMPNSDLVSAKEIAENFRLPHDLLGKVLQALSKSHLVESVHGSKGGYRLKRPLEELTLGSVLAAIEGPTILAQCQDDPEACVQFCTCNIREPVVRIQAQLNQFVNDIKLSAFRQEAYTDSVMVKIQS